VSKLQPPPKPQTQFLLQDFTFQPIPWKKTNVPEPVMSSPITKEQQPEREAMKRKLSKKSVSMLSNALLWENCSFSLRGKKKWRFLNTMAM
jgi:hypothetical protein